MWEWMSVLPQHKFEPRHFEADSGPRSPIARALHKLGKTNEKEEEEESGENNDDAESGEAEEKDSIRIQENMRPIEVAAEI